MQGECVGYLPNGNVCRRPATRLDPQAGGMLCEDCWRAKQQQQVVRAKPQGKDAQKGRTP